MTPKQWRFFFLILLIIFINWYFNNIILNIFSFVSSIPKLIAITVMILFVMFPRFMNEGNFIQLIPDKK